jgi:hypothetical protein
MFWVSQTMPILLKARRAFTSLGIRDKREIINPRRGFILKRRFTKI